MPFFQHRRLTIWVRPIFSLLTLSNVMRHSTVVSTFATSPFILENNVLAEPRVDCGVETISVCFTDMHALLIRGAKLGLDPNRETV